MQCSHKSIWSNQRSLRFDQLAITHLDQDVCIEDEDYDSNFVAQFLHLGKY